MAIQIKANLTKEIHNGVERRKGKHGLLLSGAVVVSTKMTSCGSVTSEDILVTTVDQCFWCRVTSSWCFHCSGTAALWFPCLGDPG